MEFTIYKDLTTFNYEKEPYPDEYSSDEEYWAKVKTEKLNGGIIYVSDEGKEDTFNVYAKGKDLYIAKSAPFENENVIYAELDFSKACSKAKTFMVNSAIRKRTVTEQASHVKQM
ncbi:MAG: hypothetical protein K6D02_05900 [Lachnospiraceae bacterium]|nr:hypothetical protein [Lachnospiraceae bacterium]